ncbi:MAG: hypothetical protein GY748_26035 [Planctomycetaceae bacterium]|nr:hypothetical protein [Planctomycetaceae bacterium]
MSKLQKELDNLLSSTEGGGFGDPDALRDYERKIENLRFKISRRDNYKIAVMSAVIGAIFSIATLLISDLVG